MRLNVQRFRPYILLVVNILNVIYHIKSGIKSYLVKINLVHLQIPGFPRYMLTPRSSLYDEQFQRYGLIFPEKRDTFFKTEFRENKFTRNYKKKSKLCVGQDKSKFFRDLAFCKQVCFILFYFKF